MHRRTFLIRSSATAAALLAGCSSVHSPEGDAGPAEHDGGTLFPDASRLGADAAVSTALAIAAPFRVLLNDPSCSHNGHDCYVEAGTWNEDVEISFLGGSHEVRFWVSELVRLERGERIPFATVGPGPGHGHCGHAWRSEVGPFDDSTPDRCAPRGTAMCSMR
ncbi:MAG: hypothetical protein U0353_23845 [Sandaracinus sp.]